MLRTFEVRVLAPQLRGIPAPRPPDVGSVAPVGKVVERVAVRREFATSLVGPGRPVYKRRLPGARDFWYDGVLGARHRHADSPMRRRGPLRMPGACAEQAAHRSLVFLLRRVADRRCHARICAWRGGQSRLADCDARPCGRRHSHPIRHYQTEVIVRSEVYYGEDTPRRESMSCVSRPRSRAAARASAATPNVSVS